MKNYPLELITSISQTISKPMTANEKLIDQLDKARTMLLVTIKGLDEETLSNSIVSGTWTTRDILGNLVSWGDELRREVQTILSEAPTYDYTIRADDHFNAWNLAQAEQKKTLSWQAVFEDFKRDYKDMIALIDSLSKAQLITKGPVPWDKNTVKVQSILKIHPGHIKHHDKALKKWRKTL